MEGEKVGRLEKREDEKQWKILKNGKELHKVSDVDELFQELNS